MRESDSIVNWSWVVVFTTTDEWTARLLKAALNRRGIRCKLARSRRGDYLVSVPDIREEEANEVVDLVEMTISDYGMRRSLEQSGWLDELDSLMGVLDESIRPTDRVPKAAPAAVEKMVIASREGVGEIAHYMDHGYELRVGPEPYYRVEESRWEEFTDFSAQRQEFAILLKTEYPRLYEWIRENKMMAEFIKLVESTYREVPPPRRRSSSPESTPQENRKMMILGISAAAIIVVLAVIAVILALVD